MFVGVGSKWKLHDLQACVSETGADAPAICDFEALFAVDKMFLLDIDLKQVQENLSESGTPISNEAVESWLCELGFVLTAGGWIGDEDSLLALDENEYRVVGRF